MDPYAIFGHIIHCISLTQFTVINKGFVIIGEQGKVLSIGDREKFANEKSRLCLHNLKQFELTQNQILIPGLIDSHIHAPQYPNAGLGYDQPLLEWLNKYTYNLEMKYKNQALCKNVFSALVKKTLAHGTTTACYFGSLYANSTMILGEAVTEYGQRALIGKINMIRLAPDDYLETSEESLTNTRKFIEEVNKLGNPLLKPVITPRFAPSVDMELMKQLGTLAKEFDLHIQTHISENKDEVQLVKDLYNDTYANVYYKAGLLTPKTVLAHGIYLSDDELKILRETKTSISHCPESNVNLVSGICDVKRLRAENITVGLGTDVAGGASPSIITTMKAAIAASTNLSFMKENYQPITYIDAFYMATLGGAKALALDNEIGNFEVGKAFDALIIDMDVKNANTDLLLPCSAEELLQKFIYVGDDRNVKKVFVNGRLVNEK